MDEAKFWELIDFPLRRYKDVEVDSLTYRNIQMNHLHFFAKNTTQTELIDFQEIMSEKIYQLFIPKIGEIALISCYDLNASLQISELSTDGFIDFRAWIISLGQLNFKKFFNFQSEDEILEFDFNPNLCLLYTSPSPRDATLSRMPSSA